MDGYLAEDHHVGCILKKLMLYGSLSLLGEATEDSRKYTGRYRIMSLTLGKYEECGIVCRRPVILSSHGKGLWIDTWQRITCWMHSKEVDASCIIARRSY